MNDKPGLRARIAVAIVLIVSVLALLAVNAETQSELNYDLSEAVGRRDIVSVQRLLKAGANPDAPWSGYSWQDQFRRMFHIAPFETDISIIQWVEGSMSNTEMTSLLRRYIHR